VKSRVRIKISVPAAGPIVRFERRGRTAESSYRSLLALDAINTYGDVGNAILVVTTHTDTCAQHVTLLQHRHRSEVTNKTCVLVEGWRRKFLSVLFVWKLPE